MNPADINSGDTSWVLFCAAAVLFMTPGLALFYAGMVSRRNTLVMLQQNVIALGVISLTWVMVGYSLAFGNDTGNGLVGDLKTSVCETSGWLRRRHCTPSARRSRSPRWPSWPTR